MPAFKDLTGKDFGRLTVLKRAENNKHGQVCWLCVCICKTKLVVSGSHLNQRKGAISCGCWHKENLPDHARKNFTKHGLTSTPEYRMWVKAKSRAKEQGLPFDLEVKDIVIPSHCPVFNIPLACGTNGFHPNSPSLDKLIPNKGYVKGNVRVISNRANEIKKDASLEELEALTAWLKKELQNE